MKPEDFNAHLKSVDAKAKTANGFIYGGIILIAKILNEIAEKMPVKSDEGSKPESKGEK
jgi:hypothetical protein